MRPQPTRRRTQTLTATLAKRMLTVLCTVLLVFSTPLQSLAQDSAAAGEVVSATSDSTDDADGTEGTSGDVGGSEEASDSEEAGEASNTEEADGEEAGEAEEASAAEAEQTEETSTSDADPQTDTEAAEDEAAEEEVAAVTLSDISLLATTTNVSYIDANGDERTCTSATVVDSDTTTWGVANSTTWYVVTEDVTVSSRIEVAVVADVHLILMDGVRFNAEEGIGVISNASLTIYGQSAGTGQLFATGTDSDGIGKAGIGGDGNKTGVGASISGTIIINGGTITATGAEQSAGIGGGGNGESAGSITINGGIITATGGANVLGGSGGAGIGGGYLGDASSITITGGIITATGQGCAAGIGGGNGGSGDSITISGGIVNATGGYRAAAIGGGNGGTGLSISITGGIIIASTTTTDEAGVMGNGYVSDTVRVAFPTIDYGNDGFYYRYASSGDFLKEYTAPDLMGRTYIEIYPEASASFSPNTAIISVGESLDLTEYLNIAPEEYLVTDSGALGSAGSTTRYISAYAWTTSDRSYATVDGSGTVTGVYEGTATITVTATMKAADGTTITTATAQITITVTGFTLTIYKYTGTDDESEFPGTPIAGAVFSVVKSTLQQGGVVTNSMGDLVSGGAETVVGEGSTTSDDTTGEDGKLVVKGLELNATYIISETKAPSGYTLADNIYIKVVWDEGEGKLVGYVVDVLGNYTYKEGTGDPITLNTASDGSFIIKVYNEQIESLPTTGGPGTLYIFASGIALMALAAYVLYRQRKGAYAFASHAVASPYQVHAGRPFASCAPTYQARTSKPRPTCRRIP